MWVLQGSHFQWPWIYQPNNWTTYSRYELPLPALVLMRRTLWLDNIPARICPMTVGKQKKNKHLAASRFVLPRLRCRQLFMDSLFRIGIFLSGTEVGTSSGFIIIRIRTFPLHTIPCCLLLAAFRETQDKGTRPIGAMSYGNRSCLRDWFGKATNDDMASMRGVRWFLTKTKDLVPGRWLINEFFRTVVSLVEWH